MDECKVLIKTTFYRTLQCKGYSALWFVQFIVKHSHFCVGQAQSIQCAMMQHTTAVGRCPMRPALTNTHLVNLPIESDVGYPAGSVTKNWFSCKWNQPFKEDMSYCLSWLTVFVCTLVQSKTLFSDPPVSCRTLCWPTNCWWIVTVLPQGNV